MMRNSRCRSFSCAFSVGKRSGMARRIVHHLREDHGPRRRERPPRPPQMQRARMPVTDGLLARRCLVDRVQRQGDLDELLSWRLMRCPRSYWGLRSCQQLGEVVVDAGHPEVRLALERLAARSGPGASSPSRNSTIARMKSSGLLSE